MPTIARFCVPRMIPSRRDAFAAFTSAIDLTSKSASGCSSISRCHWPMPRTQTSSESVYPTVTLQAEMPVASASRIASGVSGPSSPDLGTPGPPSASIARMRS